MSDRILITGDEGATRVALDRSLRRLGYELLVARGGEDALSLAVARQAPLIRELHGSIHLLLTDGVVPLLAARELAEHLTAERPAMSGLSSSDHDAPAPPPRDRS